MSASTYLLYLFYGTGVSTGGTPMAFGWDGSQWNAINDMEIDNGGINFSLGQFRLRNPRDVILTPDGMTQVIAGEQADAAFGSRHFICVKFDPEDGSIREFLLSQNTYSGLTSYTPPYFHDIVEDPANPPHAFLANFRTNQILEWDGISGIYTGLDASPSSPGNNVWNYLLDPWPGWSATSNVPHSFGGFSGHTTFIYIVPCFIFYHNSTWYFMIDPDYSAAKVAPGASTTTVFTGLCTAPSMGNTAASSVDIVKLFKMFANTTGGVDQEVYPLPPLKWNGNVLLSMTKVSHNSTHTIADDLDWVYVLDSSGILHTGHNLNNLWDTGIGENESVGLGLYLHESTNTVYAFYGTGKNMGTGGYQGDYPPGNKLHVLRLESFDGSSCTWTELASTVPVEANSVISYDLAVTTDDQNLFIVWTYESYAYVYTLDLNTFTFTSDHIDFGPNDVMFVRVAATSGSEVQLIGN